MCLQSLEVQKKVNSTSTDLDTVYITLFKSLLITGNNAKLMPLVIPTCTILGIEPAKKAVGPSAVIIFLAQSKVPEYNSFAASPCIRDFTQSCGCVRSTEPPH